MSELQSPESAERPIDYHSRIKEIEQMLAIYDRLTDREAHISQVSDMLLELDMLTDLDGRELIFSGTGVRVDFANSEVMRSRQFYEDLQFAYCNGFDLWQDYDDEEKTKVYLLLCPQDVVTDEFGEIVEGSVYYLDPFNSAIIRQDAYLKSMADHLTLPASEELDSEEAIERISEQQLRYGRMIQSRKYKNLDRIEQMSEIERALRRINVITTPESRTFDVITSQVYVRDIYKNEQEKARPRVVTGAHEITGQGIAFVSLHAVMPEECKSPRDDRLCLAMIPDERAMYSLDLNGDQVVFVPLGANTELAIVEQEE